MMLRAQRGLLSLTVSILCIWGGAFFGAVAEKLVAVGSVEVT